MLYAGRPDFYVVFQQPIGTSAHRITAVIQVANQNLQISSDDAGTSWSSPKPFPSELFPSGSAKPAVGKGLLLPAGQSSSTSRLALPFVCVNGSQHGDHGVCQGCHSCVAISDDHGQSWRIGAVGQLGTRESQLAWLPDESADGTLYINERNMGALPGNRLAARSTDRGDTVGMFENDTALPEPVTKDWTGIVASILAVDDGKLLLFTGPNSKTARVDLVVRHSCDGGRTWSNGLALHNGPAGYSDMVQINSTHVGVLFEAGNKPGDYAESVVFRTFAIGALEPRCNIL